jgi:hypothetical protein
MQQWCGHAAAKRGSLSPLCPCCLPRLPPQSHLSRSPLNPDMAADQRGVVGGATRLLQAMVDVISSSGWLNPALAGAPVDAWAASSGSMSGMQLHLACVVWGCCCWCCAGF